MLRSIIDVKKFSEDYHSTDNHVITINGVLANNVVIKFVSTNRNDTSYKIDYTSSTRDLSYSDRVTYAAMNNMYKKVVSSYILSYSCSSCFISRIFKFK